MTRTVSGLAVAFTATRAADLDTDLLVLPVFEGEDVVERVPGLDEAAGGAVRRALVSGEIQGKPFELFLTSNVQGWRAGRLALIGAGKAAEFDTERLRRVATAAGTTGRQRRIKRLGFLVRGDGDPAASVQAVTEGLMLANFSADRYKSGERAPGPIEEAIVCFPGGDAALQRLVERGRILGESCNISRELCNEPSNVLTPSVFAERAAVIGREAGLAVEFLDEDEIAQLNMGLLLGVARGSAEPPRVIVLRHEPSGAPATPVLGLVGKGITFDTGGISIKPADGMDRMKDDMAGGAAVICAMRAISLLKAPINVIGVVPASENMPGGRAIKPGDVLTGASGKTVEVVNTDAEGRLILGDGLWYAQKLGATHLLDVATLTGACVVGATAERAGDRCWPMPLYDDYAEQLRSEVADMVNSGGRPAGSCTAAMFLKEFAGGLPWAHLDIAGTAWAEENKAWQQKGATGVAVRTLAELAFTSGQWR
jgi:leucyl aminopeptidase